MPDRTRATRATLFGTLIFAAACASSGATVDDSGRQAAAIYQGSETPTIYSDVPRSVTGTITKPVAATRAAVRQAFLDYSIPVTLETPANGQIGNPNFYRTRDFMGRPMTELVSCGGGITGPNAATYRIFMSLIVTAKADASGGTVVGVLFQATARDMVNGTANDRLVCSSTGRIEQLLLERIRVLSTK